jgi:dipeptidyl-peptidase-4
MYKLQLLVILCFFTVVSAFGQRKAMVWTADGLYYLKSTPEGIIKVDPKTDIETALYSKSVLTPAGASSPLKLQNFMYSADRSKMLLFTNTAKVWRYNTRGDYYVLNTTNNQLKKLGAGLPEKSLMFAKFSPGQWCCT